MSVKPSTRCLTPGQVQNILHHHHHHYYLYTTIISFPTQGTQSSDLLILMPLPVPKHPVTCWLKKCMSQSRVCTYMSVTSMTGCYTSLLALCYLYTKLTHDVGSLSSSYKSPLHDTWPLFAEHGSTDFPGSKVHLALTANAWRRYHCHRVLHVRKQKNQEVIGQVHAVKWQGLGSLSPMLSRPPVNSRIKSRIEISKVNWHHLEVTLQRMLPKFEGLWRVLLDVHLGHKLVQDLLNLESNGSSHSNLKYLFHSFKHSIFQERDLCGNFTSVYNFPEAVIHHFGKSQYFPNITTNVIYLYSLCRCV